MLPFNKVTSFFSDAIPESWLSYLKRLNLVRLGGLIGAILIMGAVFAIWSDGRFLIGSNLLGMLRSMGTMGMAALGLTVILVVGEIDLSFANLATFSSMFTAVSWIVWGWPVWLSLLVSLLLAAGWGLFNAFFVAVVKVPSFIATLGSSQLILGFTLYVSESKTYNPSYPPPGSEISQRELDAFLGLSNQDIPVPMQLIWLLGFAILFGVLMSRGVFGFRLKAIGGNEPAAILAKLPVRRYKTLAFVIGALMATVAGLLDFAFIGSVQPNPGQALLFPVFAAVIIGGASLTGGRGTVSGTLLGALLLAVISNGLALNATGPFARQMLLGFVTIGAVVLDQFSRRRDS